MIDRKQMRFKINYVSIQQQMVKKVNDHFSIGILHIFVACIYK